MNAISRLFAVIAITLLISACQTDNKSDNTPVEPQPTVKKLPKSVGNVQKEVEIKDKQPILDPKTLPSIDLNVSDEILKNIKNKEQNDLSKAPPQISEEAAEKRKVKISGGVLFDGEQENMVDRVDGGKVNISIPLN